jgi:hypothetical protein
VVWVFGEECTSAEFVMSTIYDVDVYWIEWQVVAARFALCQAINIP